ncbi:SDR family NAD(P)-dependent oxidoreductase [Candidimonas nitroreducens]|uniref:3-oxoacyl-ACP reductase n=1 Tax=Candidimonas nitroreducens TaxID=683354 RepID=A0A225MRY4_9BURK|nr:SDR family oxidoreductase [Candidimonas nitroreducens]OWT64036.1 3-oxoacyl-ACP reductase [Candidimonas nitroreducens]
MDLELAGKHVLITGGSRGIGLACAEGFGREGARISIVGRDAARLDAAVARLRDAGIEATGYRADLTDAAAALQMIEAAEAAGGPVDILVNSAGAARRVPFPELTPQVWQNSMQAKFFSYINVIDPLIKRMGQRKSGAVVNVVGMGGKVASTVHISGGAANAALMLASAGLAAAYGPLGVRVNAVNPTVTLTDRMSEGLKAEARARNITEEAALQRAQAKMPLGHIASPEEIANAVLFLCSPRASYISGVVLCMDGAATPMVV